MTTPVIPPDTVAPGQTGHVTAHNEIADALEWLAAQVNALPATYMPLPSGTPVAGTSPVVRTVSPLGLSWAVAGTPAGGNIDGGTAVTGSSPAGGIDGGGHA